MRYRLIDIFLRDPSFILLDTYSFFFFSSRRRHTRSLCDWSSDVCSSDLTRGNGERKGVQPYHRCECPSNGCWSVRLAGRWRDTESRHCSRSSHRVEIPPHKARITHCLLLRLAGALPRADAVERG